MASLEDRYEKACEAMRDRQDEIDAISFGTTSHYNQYNGFEVIDVCEQLRSPDGSGNFNRGNAFKYLARAGWKNLGKEVEDLEKALQYIQREINRVKARGEA